jgi:short-subunit dehydrogenase
MTELRGQVVLITGASSGIGEATARAFAPTGVRFVLAARRLERLLALAQEIERAGAESGASLVVPTDISRAEDIEALVAATLDRFGRIDILFNNAGLGRIGWLEALTPDEIRAQFDVNILGMILLTRAVLPAMQRQRSGHIINMASMAAKIATPGYTAYAATKSAVAGFSEALRREVAPWGIHVSLICPGGAQTEFGEKAHIERRTGLRTPRLLRLSADDVARTVVSVAHRPRRQVILPWPLALGVAVNRLAPWLIDWVSARFVQAERPEDLASR